VRLRDLYIKREPVDTIYQIRNALAARRHRG
jgi:hypothetical protein